ncbi:MAG: hypothetical protein OQJ97_08215 [Rhodospirillales bacterium]|nr:hypothetical protein [Rhodospirillales bacterium]
MTSELVVWDSHTDPVVTEGICYRWMGYKEDQNIFSLLLYIENHGERLRRRYLSWVHDLGEKKVAGKKIVDHLELEEGFSYWWMTKIAEKSPWKTSAIIDAIRIFALEEIILELKPGKIILVGGDQKRNDLFRDFCCNLDIVFEWRKATDPTNQIVKEKDTIWQKYQALAAIKSLASHVYRRWPLRLKKNTKAWMTDRSLFLCSFFFHLDEQKANIGQFYTNYWEDLHQLTKELELSENWLQLYYPHHFVPDAQAASDLIDKINKNSHSEFHRFLDSYLTSRMVIKVALRFIKLNYLSWRADKFKEAFVPQGSSFSLWPIMKTDWMTSMTGVTAIDNLLWVELFNAALADLPPQKKGVFLYENQAWEKALIYFWRKHGHGELIGAAHSSVRFWDVCYRSDPKTIKSKGNNPLPIADITAVNGPAVLDDFFQMGFTDRQVVSCEALRYCHLSKVLQNKKIRAKADTRKVLLLGDYTSANTLSLINTVKDARTGMPADVSFTLKPHPNYSVDKDQCAALGISIVGGGIGDLLTDYDIAFASNTTTAAVDAYLHGLPVIVMRDEETLNFSPLRDRPDVLFVSTSEEFLTALRDVDTTKKDRISGNDIYYLDKNLPRWCQLIALS